jgi:hypothetical protein
MYLIKYFQKHKTATCFGTGLPSSGTYSDVGVQSQNAYVGTVSPFLKLLKYYNSKIEKFN